MILLPGERAALFIGPVPEDKLPKDAAPGRILAGSLALSKKGNGNGEAPSKILLTYRYILNSQYILQSMVERSWHIYLKKGPVQVTYPDQPKRESRLIIVNVWHLCGIVWILAILRHK